jgi:DNA-binding response OmpR family regulator
MLTASTTPTSTSPAVLVVEDDESVRRVLHRMLTFVGSRTTTATDSATAVAVTLAQPDLALALTALHRNLSKHVQRLYSAVSRATLFAPGTITFPSRKSHNV